MSEANGLAPTMEKAVVSWHHGCLVHGNAPERMNWDGRIQVSRSMNPPGPPRGQLAFSALPVLQLVFPLDGSGREVQTFRVRWFDGAERFMCYCAACGDLAFGDQDDLTGWALTGCRKCGMSATTVGDAGPCLEWHTFGGCLRCPCHETVIDPAPVRQDAGPAARPAPPAGPATTEQGPGSGDRHG